MGGNPGDPGCEGDPFEDFPCNRVVSRTSFFCRLKRLHFNFLTVVKLRFK